MAKTLEKNIVEKPKKTTAKSIKKAPAKKAYDKSSSGAQKTLVIIESPTKAKTIQKYLGNKYEVTATVGHIRDLPKSQMGVDIDNNFEPKYIPVRGKADLINKLKKDSKASKNVILATDPDREGEAIAWHAAQLLGLPDGKNRVAFNEITKNAVINAFDSPRQIDMNLVNAQQARRILDRILGYKLSPILWKRVQKGLSAGRVQSVTTRLIVEREKERNVFVPKEYWTIDALLATAKRAQFTASFFGDSGGKIDIDNKEQTDEIVEYLKPQPFIVTSVKKSSRSRNPQPPFTTSTLQQDASKKLNFQSKKTMQIAQELYEGIDVEGQGSVGLITYMRTDSLRISEEAQKEAQEHIISNHGKEYYPEKARIYKSKSSAQDAHEAIRPTSLPLHPDKIKKDLSNDQYKLYKLIYSRFLASQMSAAVYDVVSVEIRAGKYIFKASGSTLTFAGYTKVYEEADRSKDKDGQPAQTPRPDGEVDLALNTKLPELKEGDKLDLKELKPEQHFTQPPPRYTEASLIKELEENGIGRPSTYVTTITTILARGYVVREGKVFVPTELGEITTDLMKTHFKDIVDVNFTAAIEENLDEIENGGKDWLQIMREFYGNFAVTLETANKELGDSHYEIPVVVSDVICENCGVNMVVKTGRYGSFLACPNYPECKNTKPILKETGALCPKCGGRVVERKSKAGKKYFGCEYVPKCDFMTWDEPKEDKCPKCGQNLYKKSRGNELYCINEACT